SVYFAFERAVSGFCCLFWKAVARGPPARIKTKTWRTLKRVERDSVIGPRSHPLLIRFSCS
ncbi:MAG: hypothetical protein PV344_02685, partial [Anaplasma sp.]|nr:hypothetical protein [Anaplasma sp.]